MLREPARVLNKRFEREPSKETGYKQFCGIFDLVYKVAGQETRTFSKKMFLTALSACSALWVARFGG